MLATSKDVLYLVIATSVIILTFFFSWALYYIVMILKKSYTTIKEVSELVTGLKEKLDRLEELFNTIEEKIKHSASYLPLLFKGISELLELLKKKRQQKSRRKLAKEK